MPDSVAQPLIQSAMQYAVTIGIPTLVGLGARLVWAAANLKTSVDAVKQDVGELKSEVGKLEEQFIQHLQSGYDYARRR